MKKFEILIKKSGLNSPPIKIEVPDRDIRLMEFIPLMYPIYDKIIESEINNHLEDISCRKGCGKCCNQLVPIIIPEAFLINDLITSFSHKKQVQINKRFTKIINIIKTAGLFDDLRNPARNRNIDEPYFNLKLKCPFLEDEQCILYKSRPFACREYYVTNEPQYCSDPYHNEIHKIKIKRNIGSMMAAFTARLYSLPPVPIPMILIPDWTRENISLGTKKWPGVWLFNKMMSALITLNDDEFEILSFPQECRQVQESRRL